ncbi:MAG: hypothetical protein NVSMB17_11430 [Candidatus Dormibacteria bacterium]
MAARRLLATLATALLAGSALGAAAPVLAATGPPPATGGGDILVGAAVADYTPPCGPDGTPALQNCSKPPGFVDPVLALCSSAPGLTGKRLFAFEEPYLDQKNSGHYDPGDPFVDCNGDGRWDGNYIGGGSGAPRFYDHVADPVTARAMVVANGTRTIAVEVLDHEGAFNVYLQEIRRRVGVKLAALAQKSGQPVSLRAEDVFISSTHDESAPDSLGLYGPQDPSGTLPAGSSTNKYWVDYFEEKSADAVVAAYQNLQPAVVSFSEAIQPPNLRQCFSSYPYIDDQLMPTLRAVNATTGAHIVTLASVSQHTETMGFNGGSAADPGAPTATTLQTEKTWLSADWPYWFRKKLETDGGGGVAIQMAGSVGSNETPEVFSAAISRVPQRHIDESHPAGCRTLYDANGTMTPLGYYSETKVLGEQLAAAVTQAAATATPTSSKLIDGARADACIPVSNAVFTAGGILGIFSDRPTYTTADNCTVAVPPAPNGTEAGNAVKSEVAAFRIGDGSFVSIPGEVFPFTYLRGFMGPDDMPCPDPNPNGSCGSASPMPFALPPWLMPHMHTPYRFIDGEGEDMIGYIFPRGNGVGVVGEYPVTNPTANSTDRFGCGHSDDSEAASSQAADILGRAAVPLLDNLGGSATPPEDIVEGRYILPGDVASRDPLGGPEVKCNIDQVFKATGPAVAVRLNATGQTIYPASWMSLSGLPQPRPDRNTRGWIDVNGTRHWLDVFPDIQPAASVPDGRPLGLLLAGGALVGISALRRRRRRATGVRPGS